MTVPGSVDPLMLGGVTGYQISRSLRFNSADSAYLNRTPASAGNRRTFTWSFWLKRAAALTANQRLFDVYDGGTGFTDTLYFGTGDAMSFWLADASQGVFTTSQVFRDCSAWYHIVLAIDTTQATNTNRIKLYVNGSQVTAFSSISYPSQNYDCYVNNTGAHNIGRSAGASQYLNGYLTEINFIDGQALTPSSFGETDTITGVWKPKKYTNTYGTSGFYLNFSDNSDKTATTLGKDYSGNGNNWTPSTTFSVTAGAGNDSLTDTPTPYADGGNGRGNYATLNPLDVTSGTFSNGNLDYALNASRGARGTIFRSTGKWYFEAVLTAGTNPGYDMFGIQRNSGSLGSYGGSTQVPDGYGYFGVSGNKYTGSTGSAYGNTFTTNDVIGVAYDLDAGKVWFSKNGTWQASGDPAAGTNAAFTSITAGEYAPFVSNQTTSNNDHTGVTNFGQRAFAYTPPSGFLALNTQNLPDPTIKKPSSYMDVVTYTGTGSALTPTSSLGFSPDLVWIKSRSAATDHAVYDSARALQRRLETNTNDNEPASDDSGVTALNSNGFTLGTLAQVNTNTATYAAWCWDKSTTPGFDIVTYTGDGTNGRQIAHNLGVRPSMYITACRSGTTNYWNVWHSGAQSGDASQRYQLWLYQTGARNPSGFPASTNTLITSTYFTPAVVGYDNVSTATFVAYLWSEVADFSKFGSYTGNGSTDGVFVYCGFKPAFLLLKRTDSVSSWAMIDLRRSTYNVTDKLVWANLFDSEGTYTACDLLSNGFKLRETATGYNVSGGTYIFAAFAETPFKYSLAR